ncbi:MAG: hypothetical protein CMG59_05190, partial [Candidatus Marinimicrobia bacterium]|nr:hypothetical protein [Candidatus Neomarinimicrobiota bacterium]
TSLDSEDDWILLASNFVGKLESKPTQFVEKVKLETRISVEREYIFFIIEFTIKLIKMPLYTL